MRQVNIAILGCGTVGTGVARLLLENGDIIRDRIGCTLNLKYVADIDTERDRGINFAPGVMIPEATRAITDPQVDIVVETIGGEGIAKQMMLDAIANGKHVVTANKALLAKHGNEIITAATANNVDLAYEASVGGCMPIIKTVRESLIGNRISAMTGILNGTCNYILSKITDEGVVFETALAEAQENGYAEADPTLDVEGLDAAHKLAILSALAFGMKINFNDIYIEGISKITPLDIDFAAQFGYRIKLLAIAKFSGQAVEARVHPTMIPFENMLSNVNGTLNAISVSGDAVGDILLYGHGAGMMPTASAVVSDIADIARNLMVNGAGRVPVMGYQANKILTHRRNAHRRYRYPLLFPFRCHGSARRPGHHRRHFRKICHQPEIRPPKGPKNKRLRTGGNADPPCPRSARHSGAVGNRRPGCSGRHSHVGQDRR